jgi:hypothetical protein
MRPGDNQLFRSLVGGHRQKPTQSPVSTLFVYDNWIEVILINSVPNVHEPEALTRCSPGALFIERVPTLLKRSIFEQGMCGGTDYQTYRHVSALDSAIVVHDRHFCAIDLPLPGSRVAVADASTLSVEIRLA